MTNSLLIKSPFPSFSTIRTEDIEPAIKQLIAQDRTTFAHLFAEGKKYTWDNLLAPMEEMHDYLGQVWAPVSHLHAVMETDKLREAYKNCLPLLTDYHTEIMQNEALYKAIESIKNSPDYKTLTPAQCKIIDNYLRDLRLAGVHLQAQDKVRFGELQKQLSQLTTTFSENILDATHAWTLHVTEREALKGLPESAIKMAEENAKDHDKPGWLLTLDYPCYSMAIKYLANRELRWLMYEAYVTRASDQGPDAGRFDNTDVMETILKTRHELAHLLDFKNYAEYSLKTKMAATPERVLTFLNDLVDKSKKTATLEIDELTAFAKNMDGIEKLEAWDVAYYSEKLRQHKFAFSEEDLRPYFPIDKVLCGMFVVMQKLYGITVKEAHDVDLWHPSVQFFEVYDESHQMRGYFYTDLYARPHKRDGAWMDECRARRMLPSGKIQLPIAFLTCNFARPLDNKQAQLTHDDVLTLFHEFGHCLHHIMTKVDYISVSGINGVPWDAVEFPSQFLEFWCWEKEVIDLISSHEQTKETLPDALFNKMIAAKNFQSGMQMLRQLEFSLFDFCMHLTYDPMKGPQVQSVLDDVRRKVSVIKTPVFNRFQHSFSHVFAGGYAAGYYGYKWADVLSSDAFAKFEEKGIFDHESGQSFLKNILEQGGVYEPMDLYIAFRGREPTTDALLKYSGLSVA